MCKKGYKFTEEHKQKIRLALKGKKRTEETKQKMRKPKSEEYKQKIRGEKNVSKREDIRKKISLANTGKKHSEETKEKMRKSQQKLYQNGYINPMKGKKHTEEYKQKIRLNAKTNPNFGMKGKKHTEESKQKDRESKKRSYQNGYINPMKDKHHTEKAIKKIRDARLQQIFPKKDSPLEKFVQESLRKENIQFITHKSILGQPDIFIEPNICIFVDGCYWHGCEQCFDKNKFSNRHRERKVRDQFVTQGLLNQDYVVLRFWEHEIKKDIDEIILKIKNKISEVIL